MKKLITLVLTLALCVPMLLTTSIEVKASNECAHENCTVTETAGNFVNGVCQECRENTSSTDSWVYWGRDTHFWGKQCTNCWTVFGQYQNHTPVYTKKNEEYHKVTCKCNGIDISEPHTYSDGSRICNKCKNSETPSEYYCAHGTQGGGYCINRVDGADVSCDDCKDSIASAEGNWQIYRGLGSNWHALYKTCGCGYSKAETDTMHKTGEGSGCSICNNSETPSEPGNGGSSNNGTGTGSDNTSSKPASKAPTAEEIAEWKAAEIERKIKAEEAIPVTDFVSASAVNAIPTEVKENASTETVFNISKITYTRGFVAAIDKIVKANLEDKTVTLYSDNPFAFNATLLTALENANKDFVYMFKHEGHLYKVTIPAGAKVDLEGQIFAGPLYIGAKLGTTVVVK